MNNYNIVYSDSLYHHGIKGQRWGIRRYQNPDGSLTEAGKKHHEKVLNSENAKYVYKHRKELSDEEFSRTYNRIKQVEDIKAMYKKTGQYRKEGVGHEMAIAAGKQAAKIAINAAVIGGTVMFLTKTDAGRNLISKGKQTVTKYISNSVEKTATATVDAAKNLAKDGVNAVKDGATAVRTNARTNAMKAVKAGNPGAKAAYAYVKGVDRIIKTVKR